METKNNILSENYMDCLKVIFSKLDDVQFNKQV